MSDPRPGPAYPDATAARPGIAMFRAAVVLVLAASVADAQQLNRRSRDEPEVVVEAGGRVGPCDVLAFDPAGKFLFAGGDDKVVRVWPVTPKGLDTDADRARVLRWRAWREQRGGIKAVAVSPDGKRVAVGGFGLRTSSVAVIDRDSGDLLGLTWPVIAPSTVDFNAVTAVAFHPDGKRVAFGTIDGSLWVWEPSLIEKRRPDDRPSPAPRWAGRHAAVTDAATGKAVLNFARAIRFRDADTLVSVAVSGEVLAVRTAGELPEAAGAAARGERVFDLNDRGTPPLRVKRATWSADGKWLAAAGDGLAVTVASADGKVNHRFAMPADGYARGVAWDAKTGRLAVGVAKLLPLGDGPRFYAEAADELWVYDDPTNPAATPTVHPFAGRAEAMAFHPTDGRLAVAGGDADEVRFFPIGDAGHTVRGAGRRAWAVNLSADGNVLGVQPGRNPTATDPNARGAGGWARFDLARLMPTRDESVKWAGVMKSADGWRVEPSAKSRFVWTAVLSRPGMADESHPLTLDEDQEQSPTCYTFLPAKDGGPTRVIVGHYYGASLFALRPDGATRERLYTGHAGEVLAVVAAADGKWFVTGGADHTVAAWSLADWPNGGAFGAKVEVRDDAPEVTALDAGSPAWEAGLRRGDRLDLLAVDAKLVYDRRPGQPAAGTAADAAAALRSPRSGVEVFFGVTRAGRPRHDDLSTVRQRPIWKWFPAFNDAGRLTDWVVWSWHGSYYHTASAHGDRLVGWHVNAPDVGARPEYYPLQQFEKQFHRPDVIEKLVESRDPTAALTLARGDNPLPQSFAQYEPAPVRIGLGETVAGAAGVVASVAVRPRGTNVDLRPERVELWLNEHRYQTWAVGAKDGFDEMVRIPTAKLRAGENRLSVVSFNAAGGRAEDVRLVTNPKAAPTPDLLAVSVGINDYSGNRKAAGGARGFGDLSCALNDARSLKKAFETYQGPAGCFASATIELRLDANATRAKVLAAIEEAAKAAKPDDLLVVFFAGHGDLVGDPGAKPVAAADRARGVLAGAGRFMLCGPDYARAAAAQTGVSVEELFAALARVNCRKVVLLDACHAGEAAAANLVRRCVPDGHGPFVVASCDQGQLSFEDEKAGHGLFTAALLAALGRDFRRADVDGDGELGGDELYAYVSDQLPGLLRRAGKAADAQQPICFPRQPPRGAVVGVRAN